MIISDVNPPSELKLPQLYSWDSHTLSASGRMLLLGLAATPSIVLAEMAKSTMIVFNTHVQASGGISHVVLSPDDNKKYAITPDDLGRVRFACAPPVFVASYSLPSIAAAYSWYDSLSVPGALLSSGSGPVFAALSPPPEGEGSQFLAMLLDRMHEKYPPAVLLRDVRMIWLQEKKGDWVKDVVLFE